MTGPALPRITPAVAAQPVAASMFTAQVGGLVAFQLGGPLAVLRQVTDQAVPNGAWTAVLWDTVDEDTHTAWSSANPSRYTAQAPGWYEVDARADHAAGTTAFRAIALQINGNNNTADRLGKVQVPPVSGVDTSLTTSTCLYLAAGDYLETIVYQFSGAASSLASQDGDTIMTVRWCHQ